MTETSIGTVLDEAVSGHSTERVLSTGLPSLDAALDGGLRPGQLVTIEGRAGTGTSMLGLQLARHASIELGVPSLVIAPEDDQLEVERRVIAAEARVPLSMLRTSRDLEETWRDRLADARSRLTDATLHISAGWTDGGIDRVVAAVREMAPSEGLVVVDVPDVPLAAARDLRRAARIHRSALVVVASGLSDVADAALVLDRETAFDQSDPGTASLSVVRHRYGGVPGPIALAFQGHYARFLVLQENSAETPTSRGSAL